MTKGTKRKHWIKYPNITLFGVSVLLAVLFAVTGVFRDIFISIGDIGYVGAFIAGLMFPITFTAPIATAALFYLGEMYDPITVALIGVFGAVAGDLAIFAFVKDGTLSEIEEIRKGYRENHHSHDHYIRHHKLIKLFHTKPFHAFALFIGGLLILSPFPDEFGVAVFASYRVDVKKFIPLSFVLNGIGIWLIVWLGYAVAK